MIETEFFLELLVRLFADPAGLDGAGELLDRGIGRQVREIVFAFAGRAMLTDHPDLLAGQVLCAHIVDALGRPVSDAHSGNGKASREPSFGSLAPTDGLPLGTFQHGLCRHGLYVRDMALARSAPSRDGENHGDVGWIDLLLVGDADCPRQTTLGKTLTERCGKGLSLISCVGGRLIIWPSWP